MLCSVEKAESQKIFFYVNVQGQSLIFTNTSPSWNLEGKVLRR